MRIKLYIFKPFHFGMRLKYLTIDIISNSSWVFNATKGVSLAKYKSASLADCSYWKEAIAAQHWRKRVQKIGWQCPWEHLAMTQIGDIWCWTSVGIPENSLTFQEGTKEYKKLDSTALGNISDASDRWHLIIKFLCCTSVGIPKKFAHILKEYRKLDGNALGNISDGWHLTN